MLGVQPQGHPTRLEVPHPMLKAGLCPLSEAWQFESEALGNQHLLSGHPPWGSANPISKPGGLALELHEGSAGAPAPSSGCPL